MTLTTEAEAAPQVSPRANASLQITFTPTTGYKFPEYTNTVTSLSAIDFAQMSHHFSNMASVADSAGVFAQAGERSGGVVSLDPQFGCLPMIVGQDGEPVLMYKFVEVLHELVSLAEIEQELPTLSYKQIEGGITFLRALTQFNIRGLDIDAEEERLLEADPQFQQKIKDALKVEQIRVFSFEQQTV